MTETHEFETNDLPLFVEAGSGEVQFVLMEDGHNGPYFRLRQEEATKLAHFIIRNICTPWG